MRQKHSDLQLEYDNAIRKSEFKDGSLREQLKILTEKLSLSEAEVQRMIFEKNDLVNDFEEREKQLRGNLHERERAINEEKVRLAKRLEQMTSLYNDLKAQHADIDAEEA
jgi:hypothetical protein